MYYLHKIFYKRKYYLTIVILFIIMYVYSHNYIGCSRRIHAGQRAPVRRDDGMNEVWYEINGL